MIFRNPRFLTHPTTNNNSLRAPIVVIVHTSPLHLSSLVFSIFPIPTSSAEGILELCVFSFSFLLLLFFITTTFSGDQHLTCRLVAFGTHPQRFD
ncbi:hypothetical protein BDV27DRAFT_125529 [Aspergillus caelatus]|uniref:Uncharacterized protein n=2 Tax=Aspergillus subgen. Circumdati TaxID=2720871 RepID=A0A5N7A916_9EURO|nr:uncharacterized protein BDV27DRAFT_125529 [Aspergillus caelatus]KAE8366344.1 hypothetical protein BDV27DRAFT_125529 [Aspergillus caelatus]KAE8417398.1 hypothetical protein BDV36DRAFT_256912 [Aspergillus pseudocaelatus]